ncbi:MAG: hypothetical protein HQ513_13955 [Rhodospirillales bacterium]|nr:hypothetical protein [Rhodospirillales bacterium]
MLITLRSIDEALSPTGLLTLGAFLPDPSDGVPGSNDPCSLVLVGNAGPEMWQIFSKSGIDENDPAPLDNWSRQVLGELSGVLSNRYGVPVQALFPFDGPPYHPFQRWALRSRSVHPSPIGPMIHDTYGLWHAYRGAFVIASKIEMAAIQPGPNPCQSCAEKPCLTTCPVGAFSEAGYDVPACLDFLEKAAGGTCLSASCLARRACPLGRDYIYEAPHARFHMEKFLESQRP